MDNYDKYAELIARSAEMDREEIERMVEAKRARLSGLVSKEGAIQIVAAELGIILDNEKLKIGELVDGMKKANFVGKVTKIFPVREFNKNGREGKVVNLNVGDDTSNAKVVLWDTNHIDLIEKEKIKEGDVVEVANASIRNGEAHLSGFSDIKKSKEKIEGVQVQKKAVFARLKDVSPGQNVKVRALIVQSFEPKYFNKKDSGEKSALLNFVLDDGSDILRGVAFGETIYRLGLSEEEVFDVEKFKEKKDSILGEEKIFTGNVRMNSYTNEAELTINEVEDIEIESLIKELEAQG